MTFLSTFVAALPKIAPILTFCSQQIIQLIMYSLEYFLEEILTNTLKKIYYMFSIFCFLYFLLHIHISLYMYSGLYACCVCNVYAPFSPSERQDQIGSHFSGNPWVSGLDYWLVKKQKTIKTKCKKNIWQIRKTFKILSRYSLS